MNKRLKIQIIILIFLIFGLPGLNALAATPAIQVEVNGVLLRLDVPPLLENNRTLVPIRAIAEALSAKVDYEHTTKKITVKQNNNTLLLWLGKKEASSNGKNLTLDVAAKEVQGRTLLPLRFVGETLGCKVEWLEAKRLVRITSPDSFGESGQPSPLAEEMLKQINQLRANQSLPQVRLAEPLNKMARAHSQDMALNNYFSHTSPTKGNLEARAIAYNLGSVGENLAKGFPDAKSILDSWLQSRDHSGNINNPELRFMGIGVYQKEGSGPDGIYLTAVFANGPGFLLGSRQSKITGQELSVQGYAAGSQVPLTVYQLDPKDKSKYISRQTFYPNPREDGSFQMTVKLGAKGLFLVELAKDQMEVTAQ